MLCDKGNFSLVLLVICQENQAKQNNLWDFVKPLLGCTQIYRLDFLKDKYKIYDINVRYRFA